MDNENEFFLCCECVDDDFLSSTIRDTGQRHICTFCQSENQCLSVPDVGEIVDPIFRKYFKRAEPYPMEYYGSDPEEIISEMMSVDYEIAIEVLDYLVKANAREYAEGGAYYATDERYKELDIRSLEYSWIWEEFCHSIKHVSRFFGESAYSYLDSFFSNIDAYQTLTGDSAIKTINPENDERYIFRARRAKRKEDLLKYCLSPNSELSSPPPEDAKAGRMNPAGIPVFYGSYNRETCICELRPPVGSIIVTGRFEIIRPVRLLDFTVLDEFIVTTSIFDPNYESDVDKKNFLSDVHKEIRKPILPHDEVLEYLPTQATAEFLALHPELKLDGVIFSSALVDEKNLNVVLFNHASKVELSKKKEAERNKQPKYRGTLDDYGYVIETISGDNQKRFPAELMNGRIILYGEEINLLERDDDRDVTLKFDNESIEINEITSSSYNFSSRPVHRFNHDAEF